MRAIYSRAQDPMNSYGSSYAAPIDSAERDRVSCCALQPTHNAAAAPGLACFCPPSTPFFADRTGTFDGFPLSLPWPAGLPSWVHIGQRLLSMLRLGMARVAHFVLQDLGGLATLFSDRSTALFSDRTGTSDGFPLSLPWPAGLPSFVRIGPRLLSMLRLSISSASPCSA